MNFLELKIRKLELEKEILLKEQDRNYNKIRQCDQEIEKYKILYRQFLWALARNSHNRENTYKKERPRFALVGDSLLIKEINKLEKEAMNLLKKAANIQEKISERKYTKRKLINKNDNIKKKLNNIELAIEEEKPKIKVLKKGDKYDRH